MAEGLNNKITVSDALIAYVTKEYSEEKLDFLFVCEVFKRDPNTGSISVDQNKLIQLADVRQDQQLVQLVQVLKDLVASDAVVEVVEPSLMAGSTQDR